MLYSIILVISFCYTIVNADVYDSYTGCLATDDQLAAFEEAGITASCTNDVEPCDEDEWRRVDGTCNNLNYPSRGGVHTPQIRLLEPYFNTENGGFEPRLTKSGKEFDLARHLRLRLLADGFGIDDHFTQIVPYYMEFVFGDLGTNHDILNYVFNIPYCCEERGKSEFMCIPNKIRDDDYVHRFTNIRCMNLTRPIAYQNVGCVSNDTVPERLEFATTTFDISMIYDYADGIISTIRTNSSGMLKVEIVDGKEFPTDGNEACTIQQAIQTDCTRNVPNTLLGTNLFTTLYWRYHNFFARKLLELNPSWDNDMIFYTARDINIGVYVQILYYEFWASLIGEETLINEGIISEDLGFRDLYDSETLPLLIMESVYAMRYFHTVQDGTQKLYDTDDSFVNTTQVVNFNARTHYLAANNTMSLITHGMYNQPCGGFDHTVDTDMANKGLGRLQEAFDIPTADLAKGRYFGFAPYIKYRDLCTNKTHTSFEDLSDVISPETLEVMKEIYKDPSNIELMAGMWSEKMIEGGHVPPTLACISMHQLKRSIVTDRHWPERPNRPHAFTEDQLLQIRNASIARLLCDVGDNVTQIQPRAFLKIGTGNTMISCDDIPSIDLSPWQEDTSSSECENDD